MNSRRPKKIVIVTTAQPSTNPRMVKEYMALKQAGYDVKVLYCYSVYWAEQADRELFDVYGMDHRDFILTGGSPSSGKLGYFITRVKKKLADKYFPDSIHAIFRTSYELYVRAPQYKADLYIAHNIGALPAAVHAARQNGAKAAFDAEDYHRGEVTMGKLLMDKNSKIEDRYFPLLDFFYAASPMILKQYTTLFPEVPGICINNVFSARFLKTEQQTGNPDDQTLRLWWFSQKIGKGRGLEDIIRAIGRTANRRIHLTLIGIIADDIREMLTTLATESGMDTAQLHIMAPVSEPELFRIGHGQDIGLALETGEPDNRKYCLTNKIFSYLLCGNAIIFSDSLSQKSFYEEHPECGSMYERGNVEALRNILEAYAGDDQLLQRHKTAAATLAADQYNWEYESGKLVDWVAQQL